MTKSQEKKDKAKDEDSASHSFPGLVRTALKILDNHDPDGATKKNGLGFNKNDGESARRLLQEDDWNEDDVDEAFDIARHYSKTQLKEKWPDITKAMKIYIQEQKKRKKDQMPEGSWNPVEFVDDIAVTYTGWHEGKPYKLKVMETAKDVSYFLQKITLRNFEDRQIESKIRRLKIDGMDMVEFQGEVFSKNDFVNMMVFPSNCNLFTECVNALPIDQQEYREPKLYKENGFIRFPEKFYARRNDSYQRILKDALNVGPVDPEIYHEALSLMAKHPKQLTLHYAIIGANIINVIGFEDYLNTLDVIGASDSGKSFAIDITLQICYGISNAKIQDDALNSGFRHHNIAGSTNLPVHLEEASLNSNSLKRLKSMGKNIRGNADKSLTVYEVQITFIFSRNTESDDVKNIDPNEKKAQDKRIHKFLFLKEDVVSDNTEKIEGANFIQKIRGMSGGLLYEKLKKKSILEIQKKYQELKAKESKPEHVISLLGAWIMDNPGFVPVVTEIQPPTILDEFFDKILDTWHRIVMMSERTIDGGDRFKGNYEDNTMRTNIFLDEYTHVFKITATGFNLIKKSFGYTGGAETFARAYNFEYKNVWFGNHNPKSIVGEILAEYFKAKETAPKRELTKEEKKKRELDAILGDEPQSYVEDE